MTDPSHPAAPRHAPADDHARGDVLPAYGSTSLAELMPSVAGVLGLPGYVDRLRLAPADGVVDRVCTVLVDGLGALLLAERGGHAPFLRQLTRDQPTAGPAVLSAGLPSTTATSLASLGTGLAPGLHGVLGYKVLDPDRDRVVNHLKWPDDLDPVTWQPEPTLFERLGGGGVPVTMVGPAAFAGSGLTQAALRGAGYVGARSLDDRVEATLRALRAPGRTLTHLYWGDLDKVGHGVGWRSDGWVEELERIDAALGSLARRAPAGTLLVLTADHGMVDCPVGSWVDVAAHRGLRTGVRHVAGEPRLVQLHLEPGRTEEVADRWREVLGSRALVRSRAEAERDGWFGPLTDRTRARCGDVLVAARGDVAVVDTERDSASSLRMVGQHGSLSAAEQHVPLLRVLR